MTVAWGYRLDVAGLSGLTDQLDHAEQNLTNANDALKNLAPEDLGSHGIDSAAGDFQDRWEYGIGKLAEAAGKMVESLKATSKQYDEIEAAVIKTLPDLGQNSAPSTINSRLGGAE